MKSRKHIHEFFLEGLSNWLRAQGRTADANILDGIDPATFSRSGYSSGGIYGSTGNPTKGNGGLVTIPQLSYTIQMLKRNGEVFAGGSVSIAEFVNMMPPELRIKYAASLPADATKPWDPASVGFDMSKPGCRGYVQMGANGYAWLVITGSDEDATLATTVEKYIPFNLGLTQADKSSSANYGGASIWSRSSSGALFPGVYNILVYKGTGLAKAAKPTNPNLPALSLKLLKNVQPEGYTTIPAFTVNIDWVGLMTNKYSTKPHFNQIFLDALEAALRVAGDTVNADRVKSVEAKSFVPFQITYDTTNKKYTIIGAQCKKTKQYFAGITFNIYAVGTKTKMYLADMPWIFTAASGLRWTAVADQTAANASKSPALISESAINYFFKHLPGGTLITEQAFKDACPVDFTGMDYNIPVYLPAATKGTVDYYNRLQENVWTGSNTFWLTLVADL